MIVCVILYLENIISTFNIVVNLTRTLSKKYPPDGDADRARATPNCGIVDDSGITMLTYWHKSTLRRNDGIYDFFHIFLI